jgi:hypothetical protein
MQRLQQASLCLVAMAVILGAVGCPDDPPPPPPSGAAPATTVATSPTPSQTAARTAAATATSASDETLPPLEPTRRLEAQAAMKAAAAAREPWAYRALVGKAFLALEEGRLPEGLLAGLDLAGVTPGDEAAHLARSLDDTAFLLAWRRACRGGDAVARRLGAVPAEQHGRLLWQGCALWEAGLIAEAELGEAEPWALIHAHAVLTYLGDRGGADPLERDLLRRFALGRK